VTYFPNLFCLLVAHPFVVAIYVCLILNALFDWKPRNYLRYAINFENITLPSVSDPDDWQVVVDRIAYVYSAFVDRKSTSGYSLIRMYI
jgi:hypothetical protein